MIEFVVESRDGLAAAVLAGACNTYDEAKANPFRIRMEGHRTVYTFHHGLHIREAMKRAANIRKYPKRIFNQPKA